MTREWAGRFARNDAGELALHAVHLLEQRLKADFGVTVTLGAELEFTVPNLPPRHPFQRASDAPSPSRAGDYLPASAKPAQAAADAPGYETSNHVAFLHRTSLAPPYCNQFELIFAHDTPRAGLADYANLIQIERQALATDPALRADFSPITPVAGGQAPIFNGLHLNISLHDQGGNPLLGRKRDPERPMQRIANPYMQSMIDGMARMHEEGVVLLGDSVNHFQRHRASAALHGPLTYNRTHAPDNASLRIENRVPAADSDLGMAMLLTLAGVYEGLVKYTRERVNSGPSIPLALPRSPAEAARALVRGEHLLPLLDTLEPGLGNRLAQATLHKHPLITPSR